MNTIKNFFKGRAKIPIIKSHGHNYADMGHEWFLGLCMAVAVFFVGAVFLVFDFQKQMNATKEKVTIEKNEGSYKKIDVIKYAQIYSDRAKKFESFFVQRKQSVELVKSESSTGTLSQISEAVEAELNIDELTPSEGDTGTSSIETVIKDLVSS